MIKSNDAVFIIRNCFLVVAALAIAYVFFHLAIYTHPSEADDFCFAFQFRELGVWDSLVKNYLLWSGGYTSTLISGVIAGKTNLIEIYKFLPMSLLIATILSASFFLSVLFRIKLSNPWVWLGGLGYSLLFISIMPAVVSGFYWFNGAVTYQLANICLLLIFTECLRLIDMSTHGKVRASAFIPLAIFIVIGIGCTETVMAEIVILISCVFLWRISIDKYNRLTWSLIFLLTIVCFLIYALAPGNFHRATHIATHETLDHTGYDLLDAYKASVYFGFVELNIFFSSIQLWCASFLYIVLFRTYGQRRFNLKIKIRASHLLFSALLCLLLPIALQFPSQLIISNTPALRTQNAIYFAVLLSWFCLLSLFTIKFFQLPSLNKISPRLKGLTSLTASVLLVFFIGSSPNIVTAYSDLNDKAKEYDATLKKRYELVRAAVKRGETNITLDIIDRPPSTINVVSMMFNQSTTNHASCFTRYFGINSLNFK